MTNKRKSMNAGNDAHAYKLRRSAAIAKQCSKGFRDASLIGFARVGHHGHCLRAIY